MDTARTGFSLRKHELITSMKIVSTSKIPLKRQKQKSVGDNELLFPPFIFNVCLIPGEPSDSPLVSSEIKDGNFLFLFFFSGEERQTNRQTSGDERRQCCLFICLGILSLISDPFYSCFNQS